MSCPLEPGINKRVSCVPSYREPVNDCPKIGVFAREHPSICESFYLCVNGTLSFETCPNGLVFNEYSKTYHFCDYPHNINCGYRNHTAYPISSPGCPWQYGIFERQGSCVSYSKCEAGYPIESPCQEGLAYDERNKACNWPDLLDHCDSEEIIGFRCPDKPTGLSAKFSPFPRYLLGDRKDALITCVNYQPRLIKCGYGSLVNPYSLTCEEVESAER
ncbi:Protein obstructor-E [Nymphon striatum]|nr:Protein obstructor-E [Nymphon striatum]